MIDGQEEGGIRVYVSMYTTASVHYAITSEQVEESNSLGNISIYHISASFKTSPRAHVAPILGRSACKSTATFLPVTFNALFQAECSSRLIAESEKAASRYITKYVDGSLLVGTSLAPILLPGPRNRFILL